MCMQWELLVDQGATVVRTLDRETVQHLVRQARLPYGIGKSDRQTLLRLAADVGLTPDETAKALRTVRRRATRRAKRTSDSSAREKALLLAGGRPGPRPPALSLRAHG